MKFSAVNAIPQILGTQFSVQTGVACQYNVAMTIPRRQRGQLLTSFLGLLSWAAPICPLLNWATSSNYVPMGCFCVFWKHTHTHKHARTHTSRSLCLVSFTQYCGLRLTSSGESWSSDLALIAGHIQLYQMTLPCVFIPLLVNI